MPRSYLWIALALAGTPGCYLFNGLGGGSASGLDAGVVRTDAATGSSAWDATPLDVRWPSPLDASTLVERDVWYPDTGPPLPREPEPDPGPDGRPSDDPDGWEEPPVVGAEDPCCVLGEPVQIAARPRTSIADSPIVAWRPGRWALAVTRQITHGDTVEHELLVYELAAGGMPMGDPRELEGPPVFGRELTPTARTLRWAAGRWAFVASGDATGGSDREMHVRLFDGAWSPASAWLSLGPATSVDVAYLARGDGWLGFTSRLDGIRTTPFDELGGVGTAVESRTAWSPLLRAASFGSRAAVVPLRAESSPDFVVVDPNGAELGRVSRTGRWVAAGGLAAVRDLSVVAVRNEGRIEIEVVDPFTLRRVSGPSVLTEDVGDESFSEHTVDVAGSAKFGVAGVCWGVAAEGDTRTGEGQLLFQIVGQDGLPRGAAVTLVASHFRGGASCTVGTDDRGFLVAWWNGSELWVRRVDVAP